MYFTIGDKVLCRDPWKELDPHRYTLGSQIRPWKEMGACNWVTRGEGGAAGGALGRGIGGKGRGSHIQSIHTRSWGRGCLGENVRR
jgi:hypothetical protein